jgi:tetratricopeptide (TPR) repeat protein
MTFLDLRREINVALRSDLSRARALVARYKRLARRDGDPLRAAEAVVQCAKLDYVAGRLADAVRGYARARAAFTRLGAREDAIATEVSAVQALALLGRAREARRAICALRRARVEGPLRARIELAVGAAAASLGDERAAEEAFRRALAASPPPLEEANARSNLGVQLALRGAVGDAIAELDAALLAYRALGLEAAVVATVHNRGWAHGLAGRVREALEDLRAAREAFERSGDRRRAALALLDEAELRLRLGDAATAAADAGAAAEALARAAVPLEAARALLVAARAEATSGRHAASRALARRARSAFLRVGDRAGAASADVAMGRRLAAAERTLLRSGHAVGALAALLARLRRGDLQGARERMRRLSAPLRRWAEPEYLFRLARRAKDPVPGLRRAVRAAERFRARAPTGPLRAAALAARLESYLALARALLDRGRPADRREAFRVLDLVRARTLREEVGREAPGLGDAPGVRALRARLEALWGALVRRESGRGLRGGASSLLAEVERCEAELLRAIEGEAGEGGGGPAPEPARQGDHLAFAVLDGGVTGLLARGGEVEAWDCGPLAALRSALDAFRFQVARRLHGGGDVASAEACLERLASRLLPRELPESFLVTLPAELGDLPVEALPFRGAALVDRGPVLHAPSASARVPAPLPLFPGVVVGAGGEELPEIAGELDDVAAAVPSARVLRGEGATRAAILAALDGARLLHVAAHARAHDERPPLSALRVADGWLAATDLAGVDLRGALVVLSACRSGDPSLLWRGEAMAGLPRAFLVAGAAAVVASRWEIPDATARAFARLLYERLGTDPPHVAAAWAARRLRAELPHPADWAGFLVVAGLPPA